jgi:hypothetical protein
MQPLSLHCQAPWPFVLLALWAGSLVLTVLTLWTPLEFTPFWLNNVPRWGAWGLALPVGCVWWTRAGRWRWALAAIPGLLWFPLVFIAVESLRDAYQDKSVVSWGRVRYALELTFADGRWWRTRTVIAQRGACTVSLELGYSNYGSSGTHFTTTYALLPGVHWTTRRQATDEELERYDPR